MCFSCPLHGLPNSRANRIDTPMMIANYPNAHAKWPKRKRIYFKTLKQSIWRACATDIFSVFESVSDNEFVRIANYLKRSSLRKGIRKTAAKSRKKNTHTHKCPSQFKSKSTHQKRIQLISLTSRITFAIKIDRKKIESHIRCTFVTIAHLPWSFSYLLAEKRRK